MYISSLGKKKRQEKTRNPPKKTPLCETQMTSIKYAPTLGPAGLSTHLFQSRLNIELDAKSLKRPVRCFVGIVCRNVVR